MLQDSEQIIRQKKGPRCVLAFQGLKRVFFDSLLKTVIAEHENLESCNLNPRPLCKPPLCQAIWMPSECRKFALVLL